MWALRMSDQRGRFGRCYFLLGASSTCGVVPRLFLGRLRCDTVVVDALQLGKPFLTSLGDDGEISRQQLTRTTMVHRCIHSHVVTNDARPLPNHPYPLQHVHHPAWDGRDATP